MRRAGCTFLGLCVVLAACGGAGQSKTAKAQTIALTAGIKKDPRRPRDLTDRDARCLATALVAVFGKDLERRGVPLITLRDPKAHPFKNATSAQVLRVGAAIQHCKLGKFLADGSGKKMNAEDPEIVDECIAKSFDNDDQARELLGRMFSGKQKITARQAHQFADILDRCVDLATLTVDLLAKKVTLDALERACLINQIHNSGSMRDGVAQEIFGKPLTSDGSRRIMLPALKQCLPERIRPGA